MRPIGQIFIAVNGKYLKEYPSHLVTLTHVYITNDARDNKEGVSH